MSNHLLDSSAVSLTIYWQVPITTLDHAALSANHEVFAARRSSDRFDGITSADSCFDHSHGSRVREPTVQCSTKRWPVLTAT